MKPSAQARTSAAMAGWLVAGIFIGWLLFLFLPRPADEEAAKPPPAPAPSTSLTRAGLPDYTDWVGLPEIFAVWADRAEWKDGKTRFAYWHPVMKDYSYYFEATQVEGGYRFREIPEPKDSRMEWGEVLAEDCPIRFYVTDAELRNIRISGHEHPHRDSSVLVQPELKKLPIDLPLESVQPSPPDVVPQTQKSGSDKK